SSSPGGGGGGSKFLTPSTNRSQDSKNGSGSIRGREGGSKASISAFSACHCVFNGSVSICGHPGHSTPGSSSFVRFATVCFAFSHAVLSLSAASSTVLSQSGAGSEGRANRPRSR